ncbi:CDP-alcohol phosphatidyltransferase family protein (plasmid) [Streptomyces globisporus]|uniref:CDP-alcohol phosphatidyltransferase family protein n=1 Tax=Streptomyces globisporus TaxID=1908 RepID=UPI002F9135BA|nr:CDP-alcohol phosphatidyltransferase family protein [Streptomyces globisporus]
MALINSYVTLSPRPEALAGAVGQTALLLLLDMTAGLGAAAWLAGAVFTVATCALLTRALDTATPSGPFGPANSVTLCRTTLIGGVTALVAESFAGAPHTAALAILTSVALVLDAVDGRVARRTGTGSALGARFDMEADAFLILVLSVQVAASLGAWVLLIGAMRYVFVAGARPLPWLNGPLPPSTARKTVAALQGIVLLVAASGLAPPAVSAALVTGALALLVWSFGRDAAGLRRARNGEGEPVVGPACSRAAEF